MEFNTTTIIAIIGCVTGIFSTTVHVFRYLKERPKLKFHCTPRGCLYFSKKLLPNTFSSNDYFAAMDFTISNASTFSIVISDVLLDVPGFNKGRSFSKSIPKDNLRINILNPSDKYVNTISNFTEECLSFPLKIDPYATVQGNIFFLHAFDYKEDIVNGKLTFRTANKKFHKFLLNKLYWKPFFSNGITCRPNLSRF